MESAGHRQGSSLFCWQMVHLVQSVLAMASGVACLSPRLMTLFGISLEVIQVSHVKKKHSKVYTQYIFLYCNGRLTQTELTKSKKKIVNVINWNSTLT